METPALIWVDTYYFPDKNSHRVHFAHEVAYDTILDRIQSIHYTLWDPIYYYYEDNDFPEPRKNLGDGSDSRRITFSCRSSWLSPFRT